MKLLRLVVALTLLSGALMAQTAIRVGDDRPTLSYITVPAVSTNVLVFIPGARYDMCAAPANAVPCTNLVTTYTDRAESSSCATNLQTVLAGTTSCVAFADSHGRWGMWLDTATNGGNYEYTIALPDGTYMGPFAISVSGGNAANYPSIDVSALTGTGGSDMLAKFKTCEAIAATLAQPTICDARRMNSAQTWATSQTFSAAKNVQYVIGPNTFITRSSGVIATFTMDGTQLIGAGKGQGLPIVSYTSPLAANTLGTSVIDGQAWTSGNAPVIRWQVNKGVISDLTIVGDRVASGDVQADSHGGDCIQDSNLHTDNIFRNLYLANCGHTGLSLQAADRDLFQNVTIEQSSEVGFLLNAADGLVHHDNTYRDTFCFDCNTSGFGASGNYNIISSGGFGNQQDVKMINPVVRGQLGSRTPANADLSLRSQSFQGIQVLGVNGLLIQNAVEAHTRAECIAVSGENVEIAGGRFLDCAQAGGGGAGCMAIYSATQAVTYNYNVHDYDCEDSGYGVAILLGATTPANQDGNILRDIHIHHLNLHTLVLGTPIINGINVSNNTSATLCGAGTRQCNWIFDNVKADHLNITDAVNPIRYSGVGSTPASALLTGFIELSDISIRDTGSGYVERCGVSGASPLGCASTEKGTVTMAVAATTLTVNDARVQAASTITLIDNASRGTQVTPNVTCNTAVRAYAVIAIVPGVSFDIKATAAPAGNPACIDFTIDD